MMFPATGLLLRVITNSLTRSNGSPRYDGLRKRSKSTVVSMKYQTEFKSRYLVYILSQKIETLFYKGVWYFLLIVVWEGHPLLEFETGEKKDSLLCISQAFFSCQMVERSSCYTASIIIIISKGAYFHLIGIARISPRDKSKSTNFRNNKVAFGIC